MSVVAATQLDDARSRLLFALRRLHWQLWYQSRPWQSITIEKDARGNVRVSVTVRERGSARETDT